MSDILNPTEQEQKDDKHNTMEIKVYKDQDLNKAVASTYLSPATNAAICIKGQFKNKKEYNLTAIREELADQARSVRKGKMTRAEDMLIMQAHTLDALFAELIERSRANMGEHLIAAEKYLKLGLKAQSQCRTTLEALAEIKNPKPYIQNNKAQYQQVNNGNTAQDAPAPAHGGNLNPSNELLEDKTNEHQWMDTGTQKEAGRTDKELAALEPQHRPKD
ncbi:MAG: hypothetical protein ACQEQL_04475 [Pseudomonadota bacterium]